MITLIWFLIMKYGFDYPYTLDEISSIVFWCLCWLGIELLGIILYIKLHNEI
jgi:hypothetical protein